MYRQSPGRNHRSKGIKVKNVLQICLLLAVCFWLIYQVKHSHDKKKEFDESDAKAVSGDELIRLGRKDIQTRVDGTLNKDDDSHDEPSDEEEVNGEEVEENKHEEDEVEDKKVDVKEDDDDETDEHEQEKSDAEDGEEREDGDENETQNTESEDGHSQVEKESIAEGTDHDGDDGETHGAREEHYKADDASSAVTHDNEHVENSNQQPENNLEAESKENENRKELEVEGGRASNVTTGESKEDLLDNLTNVSSPNNTVTQESNDHLMSNTTVDHGLPSENVTQTKPELGNAQGNLTESVSESQTIDLDRSNNSISNVEGTQLDSNSTISATKEFPNSSNNSASENIPSPESSMEAGNNTETLLENNNEIEGEKSDTSDGTDDNLETTENTEEVQQDAIDISDTSMEEKHVRTDLETLPEMQTEGSNDDDAAE